MKTRDFCIRDTRGSKDLGGHKQTSGARCLSFDQIQLTFIATFHTKMSVPPSPKTINNILSNTCGPKLDRGENTDFTPAQKRKIKNGVVKMTKELARKAGKDCPSGSECFNIGKDYININDKKALRKKLIEYAERVKKGHKVIAKVKAWFIIGTPVYNFLVKKGGEKSESSIAKKWKALIEGIKNMTHEEMQRLFYYGNLKKLTLCMFLCAWYDTQNLLISDPGCGLKGKKKPPTETK